MLVMFTGVDSCGDKTEQVDSEQGKQGTFLRGGEGRQAGDRLYIR